MTTFNIPVTIGKQDVYTMVNAWFNNQVVKYNASNSNVNKFKNTFKTKSNENQK